MRDRPSGLGSSVLKSAQKGTFCLICYTVSMSRKKKRKSFLERAEENALEHIPEKYQKSVVGVYRLGFWMNIIGIIGAIFALFVIIGYFFLKVDLSSDTLITSTVLLAAFLGAATLGAYYTKMKLNPPLAFGWALFMGLICLVLAGFFGFILFATFAIDLTVVYGVATMLIIQSIMAALMVLPLIIFLNTFYYLFCAHKGYAEWYAGYAKRNHIGEEAKVVKKKKTTKKKKSDDYSDDDL